MNKDEKRSAIYENVDDEIAKYLNRNGVLKKDFAKGIGVTEPTLRSKRGGETEWTMAELVCVSDIIGIPVSALVSI